MDLTEINTRSTCDKQATYEITGGKLPKIRRLGLHMITEALIFRQAYFRVA